MWLAAKHKKSIALFFNSLLRYMPEEVKSSDFFIKLIGRTISVIK